MTGFHLLRCAPNRKMGSVAQRDSAELTGAAAIFNPDTAYLPSFIVREIEAASSGRGGSDPCSGAGNSEDIEAVIGRGSSARTLAAA